LQKALSDRPEVEKLERFLERLLETRGGEIEFAVLFGSMARGNWSQGSDYDVLIGLRGEDGQRLIERMYEFSLLVEGNIEVFPYNRAAWQRMFESFHPLLLEALEHGVVLFDQGTFAAMREVFYRWRADGVVTPSGRGWKIDQPTPDRVTPAARGNGGLAQAPETA
jgi:predicted nucleotidyltransferase